MTRHNRFSFAVGSFVLLATAVGILVGATLMRSVGVLSQRMRITVAFEDVAGLREGAPVRLSGLDIGVVESIEVAADKAEHRAVLSILDKPEYRRWIRHDSRFQITADNLLGSKHVAISFGTEGRPVERGEMVRGASPVGIEAILADLRRTVAGTAEISERMQRALAAADGEGQGLAAMVGHMSKALTDLAIVSEEMKGLFDRDRNDPGSLRGTLVDLRRAARGAAELMGDMQKAMSTESGEPRKLGELIANLDKTAANTERVTAELKKMLATGEKDEAVNVVQTLRDMEQAAANLKEITASTKSMIDVMRKMYPPNWFK